MSAKLKNRFTRDVYERFRRDVQPATVPAIGGRTRTAMIQDIQSFAKIRNEKVEERGSGPELNHPFGSDHAAQGDCLYEKLVEYG